MDPRNYSVFSYVVGLRCELNFRSAPVPDWHVGQCQSVREGLVIKCSAGWWQQHLPTRLDVKVAAEYVKVHWLSFHQSHGNVDTRRQMVQ